MAAVKSAIWNEWNPVQEDYQSLAELKSLAFRRLTDAIASSVQSQVRDMSADSAPFPGQPCNTSTFSSSPRL